MIFRENTSYIFWPLRSKMKRVSADHRGIQIHLRQQTKVFCGTRDMEKSRALECVPVDCLGLRWK